MLYCIP